MRGSSEALHPSAPCGIELSSFWKEEYPKGEVVG